jgi:hypothetical protein
MRFKDEEISIGEELYATRQYMSICKDINLNA